MMSAHPHADKIAEYAKDWMETEKPWERWQSRPKGAPYWDKLFTHPVWDFNRDYVRLPRTININGHEVPEPLREEPEMSSAFYYASYNPSLPSCWSGEPIHRKYLELGLCHATPEAAETHFNALCSFTRKDQ